MTISVTRFVTALKSIPPPSDRQRAFLRAHFEADGRAMTVTKLAKAAPYASWRGINLQYGKLAVRIGDELGLSNPTMDLLADCIRPKELTNEHWILIMRPTFALALERRTGYESGFVSRLQRQWFDPAR